MNYFIQAKEYNMNMLCQDLMYEPAPIFVNTYLKI
jgi:hypothetical protein